MTTKLKLQTVDLKRLSKIISLQVDHVTCIECCKYYIVPTTATCGHTLCHTCWHGRQKCPECGSKIDRKILKLNLVFQNLTEHVHSLAEAFQDLFNIKFDDFLLRPEGDLVSDNDPNRNVNDWLTSSQNHFSAQNSSQHSIQEINMVQKVIVNDIQVHTESKKNTNPTNAVYVPLGQNDWDKIEELPDSEDLLNKDKENIIGPMDIETYNYVPNNETEYSNENRRRSSRKKDNKESESAKSSDLSKNKKWTNVKKMKKEFSKLYSKNKLNVSIEMCKTSNNCKNINNITPQLVNNALCSSNEYVTKAVIETNKSDKTNKSKQKCIDDPETSKKNININPSKDIAKCFAKRGSEHESDNSRNMENTNNAAIHTIGPKTEREMNNKPNVCFIKKNLLIGSLPINKFKNATLIDEAENVKSESHDTDDIEITIKIGSTLTNICIKKKENDVQLKVNSDKEIQTSVVKNSSGNKISVSTSPMKGVPQKNINPFKPNINDGTIASQKCSHKSKKNTASADTSTLNIENGESIEREPSTVTENMPTEKRLTVSLKTHKKVIKNGNTDIIDDNVELNDLDIFDSGSVKEGNVQSLKASRQVPSAILSTNLNNKRKQNKTVESDREAIEVDSHCSKKRKITDSKLSQWNEAVFANEDLKCRHNSKDCANTQSSLHTQENIKGTLERTLLQSQKKNIDSGNSKLPATQKFSENIFSLIEKDNEELDVKKTKSTLKNTIEPKYLSQLNDIEVIELSTPLHDDDDDDSDRSVVEETPQKNKSTTKNKADGIKTDSITNKEKKLQLNQDVADFQDINIIRFSGAVGDSAKSNRNITVIEQPKPTETLETPISMNKFTNAVMHKSTPVARKSLSFSNENDYVDFDETICPSAFVAAKNTQEKEIMSKAFEENNFTSQNVMLGKNIKRNQKYYLAGSCLSSYQKAQVKQLCVKKNWVFLDNYTKELTHLIVAAEKENKAQRSAKFILALAASKWIVSYEWAEKCLQTNQIILEESYEVLDMTGEPSPKRSRLAKQKIFNGIKFFCMPPFRVLDVDTLKDILTAAGGTVVNEARAVKVTESPALLLAEPESTQDDRFIYLALDLKIVPLNYEWILNCLGSYTLCSINDLLLCPLSLLPDDISKWPSALISSEND